MAFITTLKSIFTGKKIYPKTTTNAVYDKTFGRIDHLFPGLLTIDDSNHDDSEVVEPRDADTLGGRYTAETLDDMAQKIEYIREQDIDFTDKDITGAIISFDDTGSKTLKTGSSLGQIVGSILNHFNLKGTETEIGHVKLKDIPDSNLGVNSGMAATPACVQSVKNDVVNRINTINDTLTSVSNAAAAASSAASNAANSAKIANESISTIQGKLNSNNLSFEYVQNDGLYYVVKVGADTVRKKCNSGGFDTITKLYGSVDRSASDYYSFEEECDAIISVSVSSEYNHPFHYSTSSSTELNVLMDAYKYQQGDTAITHMLLAGHFESGDSISIHRDPGDTGGSFWTSMVVAKLSQR